MVTKQRESTVDSHSGGELDWRTLLDSRDWGAVEGGGRLLTARGVAVVSEGRLVWV